ncbi:DNA-directed RNA polymerase III subunit RPC3 [Trifolium repens]|nr:DNA-directed RNA polymerase III subunit RPC3 [Trifolium repens]
MVSQWGIKFAVHLITNHFGKIVANVCEKLLNQGPLTLELIVRYTELSTRDVKNSLLVLIQHNCVQPFNVQDQSKVGTTQYLVLFDNILHRQRFPKFMEIVSQELGDKCVQILEGLLRDGRLNLKQMIDRASQGKENAESEDAVRESLCKLLTARYVERCPVPEVSVVVEEKNDKKKRGSKAAQEFKAPLTTEQRVIETATHGDMARFSLTADTGYNSDEETKPSDTSVAENVAKEELTLWRANFEEFIRYLRDKALIDNVRSRMDDGAATVLRAILEATRNKEKQVKIEKSVPLPLDTIFTEVMKTETGRTMTMDRVKASLVQLGCSNQMLYEYIIDLEHIIHWARNEEVESIVLKRYGRDAYRMFRYLSKGKQFRPTDKIADDTLVEKREAPKLLFKLWKENYLQMEKLYVTLATGNARSTPILMWKVNQPLLWEHVLDELYHGALNLKLRIAFEQDNNEEIINMSKKRINESEPLLKKHTRLQNVLLLLGSSLMKLDDTIMLFNDF